MGLAVGIDLGTTNTVVAVVREGKAETLADEGGRKLIPSFVSFHPSGKVLVGEAAKDRRVVDPDNTIYSVKRLIGRTFESDEVQRARRAMPFEIVEGDKQVARVVARGEIYTLPEISAFVLRRAKAVAEAALGEVVDKAVITVPANFNDPQRAATKLAGKLAGLEVLRILNEPTAAALAYGQSTGTAERVAVYDLGGGTFDVTLLDLSGPVFEVLATGGDSSLGGDDVDNLIVAEITAFFLQQFRFDPRVDPAAKAAIRSRAERLKHALSEREEATVEMNDIVRGEGGAFIPASFSLERKRLEEMTKPLIDRTIETCRFSIETIGLNASEIERVLLVGGATRMPMVARSVEEYFKRPTSSRVNPDEVVATGAAFQAAALTKGHSRKGMQAATLKISRATLDAAIAGMAQAPATTKFGAVDAVVEELPPDPAPVDARPRPAAPPVRPFPPRPPPRPTSKPKPPTPLQPVSPAKPAAKLEELDPLEDLELPELIPDELPLPELIPDGPIPDASAERTVVNYPLLTAEEVLPELTSDDALPELIPDDAPPELIPDDAPPELIPDDAPELEPAARAHSLGATAVSEPPLSFDFELPLPPATRSNPPPQVPVQPRVAAPDPVLPPPQPAPAPAHGAPARAAPLLIDVTPISLGVEVAGGYCDFLIRANTPVPCDRTRVFRTASDGQTAVCVRVVQGESELFSENTYLGDLELSGLRPAPRGEVEIGVTFEIDADGILNVRAKDEASGRETIVRMNLLGAQSDASEVAAMMARQRRHNVA